MYGNVTRDSSYKARLLNFLETEYDINARDITPAKRGFYGETWRVGSYFVKLDYSFHKDTYRRSFSVLERIVNSGIRNVSIPVKTRVGKLCSYFDNAVVGVFRWIDGENIENDETTVAVYDILSQVYTVPTENFPAPRINFDTGMADLFYSQLAKLDDKPLLRLFGEYEPVLAKRRLRYEKFARLCQSCNDNFFITHGDAGGNVIKNNDKFYIVDWDDTAIAAPERDAWFGIHLDWAEQDFNNALARRGIDYSLRPQRLAYYCYRAFFEYLTLYMYTHFELPGCLKPENLREGYFENWIKRNISYADSM